MIKVALKELLEAGCHFGHQKERWNPKASQFIYTERDHVHIIDLAKTAKGIEIAYDFLKNLVAKNGNVIFLGSKRQARSVVEEEAKRCGALFLTTRWPGGLFTNWEQIKKNLEKIRTLKGLLVSEESKQKYTKKELLLFQRELNKLLKVYGGVESIPAVPEAIFIVDARRENNAVRESVKTGVPIVAIVDTNTDPTPIDYPIPANDDAVGSITLIVKYMADAVSEGMKLREKAQEAVIKEAGKAEETKQEVKDEKKGVKEEKKEEKVEVKKEELVEKKKRGRKKAVKKEEAEKVEEVKNG